MNQVDQSETPQTMEGAKERAKEVATDVGHTAKEHARELGDELTAQTRDLAGEIRHRLTDEAGTQNERLATSLRQLSDDLGGMRTNVGNDSLAANVVQRLSEGSRQVADYLEQRGPDGVIREMQEFARRKPGTFLLGAAFAGFVVGRLGKGVLTGGSNGGNGSDGASRSASTMGEQATDRPTATANAPVPGSGATMPTATPTPGAPAAPGSSRQPWSA